MTHFEPALLNQIRDRFCHVDTCPYQGPRVFFENAGGALTLKTVVDTSAKLAAIPDNQGRDNPAAHELVRIIEQAKLDTRLFLGAAKGPIFVGESGTELLFRLARTAITGAQPGGQVLGSSLEHPATRSACDQWARFTDRKHVIVDHNPLTATVTADDYLPQPMADLISTVTGLMATRYRHIRCFHGMDMAWHGFRTGSRRYRMNASMARQTRSGSSVRATPAPTRPLLTWSITSTG